MQAMRVISRWVLGCLFGSLLAGTAVSQGLKEDSPFLPADYQQEAKAPEPVRANPLEKLELRSITNLGKVQSFSVYNTSVSKGFWIKLNETVEGISVSDYNKGDESVLVRSGGFTRRLKLKEAKIVALAVQAPVARPSVAPGTSAAAGTPNMTIGTANPQPNGRNAPAINNLSDDEVRARMQRVAEEIRRRRAMRRQMAEDAANQKKP